MANKYSIGIDFGTLSGRAVLVSVSDGKELASSEYPYPHAVMDEYLTAGDRRIRLPHDFALQDPQDYLEVLAHVIPDVLGKAGLEPDDIVGLGIDFTACTMLPVLSDGTPLCFTDRFRYEPQAYVKLWKHHAAQKYANRMNEIAEARSEEWLNVYGGKISSEWFFPKLWQTLEEAPEVYENAAYFIEAGDWVIWQLTGNQTRNSCTAGYKALYSKRDGYPSKDYFRALDPRLENVVADKLDCPISPLGTCAGFVSPESAEKFGLSTKTAVAVCCVDAHVSLPALGISDYGTMLAIIGTSTCHMLCGPRFIPVPGICGAVEDGILPGLIGFEAGQSCVGDHFAWFVDHCTPAEYHAEAQRRGISDMELMVEKAAALRPGESGILALDWWNGNRSILVDVDLSGMFLGMTLQTKPEELFRALIEATAFGTRMVIENYREHGIEVRRMKATGGIAYKNPFAMQVYADVIGMEIQTGSGAQGPALGSAIFGTLAAGTERGGYDSIQEASAKMGGGVGAEYHPIPENVDVYNRLFAEYRILHDYFGRGQNDVMKRLRSIREQSGR